MRFAAVFLLCSTMFMAGCLPGQDGQLQDAQAELDRTQERIGFLEDLIGQAQAQLNERLSPEDQAELEAQIAQAKDRLSVYTERLPQIEEDIQAILNAQTPGEAIGQGAIATGAMLPPPWNLIVTALGIGLAGGAENRRKNRQVVAQADRADEADARFARLVKSIEHAKDGTDGNGNLLVNRQILRVALDSSGIRSAVRDVRG